MELGLSLGRPRSNPLWVALAFNNLAIFWPKKLIIKKFWPKRKIIIITEMLMGRKGVSTYGFTTVWFWWDNNLKKFKNKYKYFKRWIWRYIGKMRRLYTYIYHCSNNNNRLAIFGPHEYRQNTRGKKRVCSSCRHRKLIKVGKELKVMRHSADADTEIWLLPSEFQLNNFKWLRHEIWSKSG